MIVYLVKNLVNEKCYVGQTIRSLRQRWIEHCCAARHDQKTILHRAIRKYGDENFSLSILAEPESIEELNRLEESFVTSLKTLKPAGYNIKPGGLNHTIHPDTRAKMRVARLGTKASPEAIARMSAVKVGKKATPESRAKISAALKGVQNFLGKKHSEETRLKMSLAHKGKQYALGHRHTEETKAKISAAKMGNRCGIGTLSMLGRHHSEESRAKMSASRKGKKQSPEHVAKRIRSMVATRYAKQNATI